MRGRNKRRIPFVLVNASFDWCDELSANKGVPTTSISDLGNIEGYSPRLSRNSKVGQLLLQGLLARVLSGAEKERYIHLVKYLTAV
jgi:hypothetical protein